MAEQPLWALTATKAVDLLRQGKVTPLQLVQAAQQRIEVEIMGEETDSLLNAVPIRCFERARQQAQQLQRRGYPADPPPGYLYGLPILIKDLTAVKGLPFIKGSCLFKDRVAQANDPLVDQIEAAGGIIIGKTNVPELGAGAQTFNECLRNTGSRACCCGAATRCCSSPTRVFGATVTPWDVTRTAGGSSGGSCAALAAGQVWLATGTDMGGSQRIPASFCGVVGLRPSVGLVPQQYTGEQAPTPERPGMHSVSGPLARNVPDLCLLLDAMVGQHPSDPLSRPPPLVPFSELIKEGRMALPRRAAWSPDLNGLAPVDPEVVSVCEAAVQWFRTQGCEVELAAPDMADLDSFHGVLRSLKFKPLAHLLQQPARSMTKEEVLWEVESGLSVTDAQLSEAQQLHKAYVDRVLSFLQSYELLITPCVIVPPFDAHTRWPQAANGRSFDTYYQWQVLSYAISAAPVPALNLPVGTLPPCPEKGRPLPLPVGLQLVGRPGQDAQVLAAAAAFERAHPYASSLPIEPRVPPGTSSAAGWGRRAGEEQAQGDESRAGRSRL